MESVGELLSNAQEGFDESQKRGDSLTNLPLWFGMATLQLVRNGALFGVRPKNA
jgi:hypothetical protein